MVAVPRARHQYLLGRLLGLVADRQREAILRATTRIDESSIYRALSRQLLFDARLHGLKCDEPLNVGAELRQVLGRVAGVVLGKRLIDLSASALSLPRPCASGSRGGAACSVRAYFTELNADTFLLALIAPQTSMAMAHKWTKASRAKLSKSQKARWWKRKRRRQQKR
jgi:hypothetical protein